MRDRGNIARNFKLRGHVGELQRHLEADLGKRLRRVRGPEEKRNSQRQKFQACVGKNVFAQKANHRTTSGPWCGRWKAPREARRWSCGVKPFPSNGRSDLPAKTSSRPSRSTPPTPIPLPP